MRPLDRVGSLKLKLGALIVAAIVATVVVVEVGARAGLPTVPVAAAALVVALVVTQLLARGMTAPLREMARATRRLAAGDDYTPVGSTARDEVGELVRAFDRMATELAQTERLRRELVANASHELRTPIAALRAVVENLADGVDEPDPDAFESLLAQVDRLQGLVEQLLDLSRLEAGVAAFEHTTVDLLALALEATATVTDATGTTIGSVEVAVPAGLTVEGDRDRLAQVLVNLLTNGLRHSPAGEPVVVAATRRERAVELTVTDRDPGVPASEAERIFGRFHRRQRDRGSDTGGTGLGLAISREIVDLHGGEIRIDTTHEHGCRVVVVLPDR